MGHAALLSRFLWIYKKTDTNTDQNANTDDSEYIFSTAIEGLLTSEFITRRALSNQ